MRGQRSYVRRPAEHRPAGGQGAYDRRGLEQREEQSWLAAQWAAPGLRRFEIRWAGDPVSGRVHCTLLGAVRGANPEQAVGAALSLRDSLGRLPAHLRAEPILDGAELAARLAPFTARPGGSAEIRKRLTGAPLRAYDAPPRPIGVDVRPLRTDGPLSWNALGPMLLALPYPAMAGVCLQPFRLGADHLAWFRHLAQEYDRLARAGRHGPANPYVARSGTDPFAAAARHTFAEAARRYADRVFRLRVSVAAEGPLPREVTGFLADALDGVVVPVAPADEDAAARAVRTLDHIWRGASYGQGVPEAAIEEPERALSDVVDLPEAAAAFRLPHASAAAHGIFHGAAAPEPAEDGPLAVVLTALEVEYAAVRDLLTAPRTRRHERGLIVESGRLPGSEWTVALARIGPGTLGAAAVTQLVSDWLRPDALFFVGVAGGLRDDIALGDVVVATRVHSYAAGREDDDGFRDRRESWPTTFWLDQEARHALRSWRSTGPDRSHVPAPRVHFKPIAAGDVLLASDRSPLAERLRRDFGDAVAVEMEGSGVAHAAHLAGGLPFLIVRGISDHADRAKAAADRAGGQPRAAAHAAAAALAVISGLQAQPPRTGD